MRRFLTIVVVVAPLTAAAQGAPPAAVPPATAPAAAAKPSRPTLATVQADVAALQARVDELGRIAADLPAMHAAAQEVESRLVALRADVDKLAGEHAAMADVRRAVDEAQGRVAELERTVAELHAHHMEEAREVEPAGHDEHGFFLSSRDGRFRLTPGAWSQFRYIGHVTEGAPDTSELNLERVRLYLKGTAFTTALRYSLSADFGNGAVTLKDAYFDYERYSFARLRAGQFKVPVSRQELIHDNKQLFVDRSVASDLFSHRRDLGVQVTGGIAGDKLLWQAGMFNGAGENSGGNDNVDYLFVARAVFQPFGDVPLEEGDWAQSEHPRLAVGGNASYELAPCGTVQADCPLGGDVDADGTLDNVAVTGVGGELALKWMGAELDAEIYFRNEDPGVAAENRTLNGGYVQASYFVVPHRLVLAARYAEGEPSPALTRVGAEGGVANSIREISGAAGYWYDGHDCKLTGEVARFTFKDFGGGEQDDTRIQLQLQLGF